MAAKNVKAVLVAAVLLAAVFWYFGADVWHSILLSGAITAIVLAATGLRNATGPGAVHWRSGRATALKGSRNDVTYLSSSLGESWGRVGHTAESRVRQLARGRLALHHLDPRDPDDGPEIERLIGRRAYRLLVRNNRRRMRLRGFLYCLDVLDAIVPPQD